VFIKIINATKIESGAIDTVNGIRGLMEHFATQRQCFRDFPLEQPAGKPVIFVT
jgi:hypothetical protein